MPKIVVYSSEKMEELINFVEEDRQRTDEHRRYKTKLEGSMGGLPMRWHPLMVPRREVVRRTSLVEVKEGMDNIIMVIEEHVVPMLMDAVVTVAVEANEANRTSVVEGMFSQAEEQKEKLQFCFDNKFHRGAVSMSPKFPVITSTMHPILSVFVFL
ncbi:uncharacterized protein LOC119279688 [Triticum dicoccoides]|uniref:uncharacterized protein LOC119279688 n=1 Tax=Triticum dicoccoides TaxID=85692 RepID=UPI00188E3D11|nr:uncharacterized protein LOC119279688 [Triticum dicoccoides]